MILMLIVDDIDHIIFVGFVDMALVMYLFVFDCDLIVICNCICDCVCDMCFELAMLLVIIINAIVLAAMLAVPYVFDVLVLR